MKYLSDLQYPLLIISTTFLLSFFTPLLYEELIFISSSVSTTGKIVDFKSVSKNTSRGLDYFSLHVTVIFTDHHNKEIKFDDRFRSYYPNGGFEYINEDIPILYNKQNPKEARVADFVSYWLEEVVLFSLVYLAGIVVIIHNSVITAIKIRKIVLNLKNRAIK